MALTVPFRLAACWLMLSCAALGQQRPLKAQPSSLPDAPSAQAAQIETLPAFTEQEAASLATVDPGLAHESELSRSLQPEFVVLSSRATQEGSSDFFDKYLCPALLKRNMNYHPSSSDGLMARAGYAASRIFVTRDEAGRAKVNTSYFLGVLGAAALHTAYRPYWNRSVAAPFSDFGSTVGNDAGMNLLHEFRPGLEQLMKNHAPKFVAKFEERIGHN